MNVGVGVEDVGDEDLPGVVRRLGDGRVDEVRHDFRLDGVAFAQRREPDGAGDGGREPEGKHQNLIKRFNNNLSRKTPFIV